ncbi:MAG TPA: heme o synthase [Alphaproteobacteria bacterium]|nr:heme o synthase [Alphaproteobacteria bacterium]
MSDVSATTISTTQEARVSDYFALLKPKVMSLVVFSGFAGLWVAPQAGDLHPVLAITAMICLAVNAGAAGAINMWFDRDIDAVMKRTKNRPLPKGIVDPDEALSFGIVLSVLSVMTMGVALNWTAAALLAFANVFYVVVYTIWLKRLTPQNIVIGGAAGAFPPMIGWAAVTGDITAASIALFAIIFFWTPPHFWALALFANEDYKRAKVPMLPVTHGEKHTKLQMLVYSILMVPVSVSPYFLGVSGIGYLASAALLSLFFVYTAVRVFLEAEGNYKSAKLMFGYSVFYLFAIFLALMIDKV